MAQTDIRFTFKVTGARQGQNATCDFDVVEFSFEEGLNQNFKLSVELVSFNAEVGFNAILDKPVCFTILSAGKPVRQIHGLVTDFVQGQTGFRRTRYSAVVEPMLARTELYSDWRIFQQQSVPEILKDVFKEDMLLSYSISTNREHLPREYCVQADETDFSFISRLIAEEGFVYRFKHQEDDHELMLTDMIQSLGAIEGAAVLYQPKPAGDQPQPALRNFVYYEHVRTARQTQRDYTFKNPRYSQEHSSIGQNMPDQSALYERYDYPGRYKQDAAGMPFTQTRIQSLRADAKMAVATGDDARIQPGLTFELTGHPRQSYNTCWRAVHIVHHGKQYTSSEEEAASAEKSTSYEQIAQVIPADVEWKAPIPAKPRILGPQIAHVTGPEGEEIYTDEYGRVKVEFPWDRQSEHDEHSSCWVRVAQNWAGAAWGQMEIPRIGQEVIVDFLNGDPDQPIVNGRTYDAINPTPYKLPALKTLATIKSKEHKGGGYNELLIDDTTGEIKTQLHSTHYASQLTLGYLTHPRKGDGSGEHRGDGFELRTDSWGAIRAGQGILLSAEQRSMGAGKQLDIQEAKQQLEDALSVMQGMSEAAKTAKALAADYEKQQEFLQQRIDEFKQAVILASAPAGIALTTPSDLQLSSADHIAVTSGGNVDIAAGKRYTLAVSDAISLFAQNNGMKQIAAKGKIEVQAQDDNVEIASAKDIKVTSANGETTVSAGKKLTLLCGGAYITLEGGNIELGCPGLVLVKSAGLNMMGPASKSAAVPDMPRAGNGQLELYHRYANGEGVKGGYTVIDSTGQERRGSLDESGYAVVSGLAVGAARVIFDDDERDPTDDTNMFEPYPEWPEITSQANAESILGRALESVSALLPSATTLATAAATGGIPGGAQMLEQAKNAVKQTGLEQLSAQAAQMLGTVQQHVSSQVPGNLASISGLMSQSLPQIAQVTQTAQSVTQALDVYRNQGLESFKNVAGIASVAGSFSPSFLPAESNFPTIPQNSGVNLRIPGFNGKA